jgi:hypothetical protein
MKGTQNVTERVKEMETANDGMKLKAKEINEWMNE